MMSREDRVHRSARIIVDYPNGAPLIGAITRAKTLRKFPYSVLYVVDDDIIIITGIASHYRDPEFYADRIH